MSVDSTLDSFDVSFPFIKKILEKKQTPFLFEKLWDGPKALLLAQLAKESGRDILLITAKEPEELSYIGDLPFFGVHSRSFPSWEAPLKENIAPSSDIVGERFSLLHTLLQPREENCRGRFIVLSLQALLQKLLPPHKLKLYTLDLKVGDTISFKKLEETLLRLGYYPCPLVADKGEFAVRGSIIDVFPVDAKDPYRLEFWGDEIDSIRLFDPASQRSLNNENLLTLLAARELELVESKIEYATIFDYLDPDVLCVMDDLLAMEDRFTRLISASKTSPLFLNLEECFQKLEQKQLIYFSEETLEKLSPVSYEKKELGLVSRIKEGLFLHFSLFDRELTACRMPAFCSHWNTVELGSLSLNELADPLTLRMLFETNLKEYKLHISVDTYKEMMDWQTRLCDVFWQGKLFFHSRYLSSGFLLEEKKLMLLATRELTGHLRLLRQKQRNYHSKKTHASFELERGGFVVHESHGVGRFCGVEKKNNHLGMEEEYFQVEYADKGQLYVPLSQANLLTKYVGGGDNTPYLNKLGSNRWRQQMKKAEKAIDEYADQLLTLYAQRSLAKIEPIPEEDSDLVRLFEDEFAYEPTEDQLKAFEAIKSDLHKDLPQDRLLVGDVGFGKTEVAMRAAFKTAVDGKRQVALLVPTAVLALQHFETFTERMANFPIRIEILTRFTRSKALKKTLSDISEGTVDIVIGTHRILSQDVEFKNLGLFIIDEEQRFGVKAKEVLQKAKITAHALSMSATPIPRTLYLSLAGVRAISEITTPPQDRLPIQLILTESNDENVRSSLMRELSRDGQAFVIYNNVETIFEKAAWIRSLLPMARIAVAHGQMDSETLVNVFHAFKAGKIDILLATTVVENGIDIPNANTIIILKADHYGLSNLYQLAGRVGRWHRRAYAYFMVSSLHRLSPFSKARLEALLNSSKRGGGMSVALRDLEMRGAGDLLGSVQSGHATTIGFALYCQKLKKAVKRLQGEKQLERTPCKISLPYAAKLTENYIGDPSLRLDLYRRFSEADTEEELTELKQEVLDRFGPLPKEAMMLFSELFLQRYLESFGCQTFSYDQKELSIVLKKGAQESFFRMPFQLNGDPTTICQEVKQLLHPIVERFHEKLNI